MTTIRDLAREFGAQPHEVKAFAGPVGYGLSETDELQPVQEETIREAWGAVYTGGSPVPEPEYGPIDREAILRQPPVDSLMDSGLAKEQADVNEAFNLIEEKTLASYESTEAAILTRVTVKLERAGHPDVETVLEYTDSLNSDQVADIGPDVMDWLEGFEERVHGG